MSRLARSRAMAAAVLMGGAAYAAPSLAGGGAVPAPPPAGAHESGGGQLPKVVPAVTDEGKHALSLLAEVRGSAGETPPTDVGRSLARSQEALARAHGAHLAGDASSARRLGVVALGWAEAARAQAGAARAEREGAVEEKTAAELALRRDRARGMLVEAQARKGQLAAQVAQKRKDVEAAKAPPPPSKGDKGGSDKKPRAPTKAAAPAGKPSDGSGKGGGGGKGRGTGGGGGR